LELIDIGRGVLSKTPVEKYPEQFETFFELFRFGDKFGISSTMEGTLNTKTVSKTTIVPAPYRIKAIYRSSSDSYVSISDGKETTIVPLHGRYKKDFTLIGVSDKAAIFRGFGKSYRLRLGFDDPLAKKETIMVALEEPNSPANHENEWRSIPRSVLVDQMRDMNQLSQYIDLKLLPSSATVNGFKVETLASESVFAQMGVVQGIFSYRSIIKNSNRLEMPLAFTSEYRRCAVSGLPFLEIIIQRNFSMKSPVKIFCLSICFTLLVFAAPQKNEKISLSVDGMNVTELIKLVAATTHKNIFIGEEIPGVISYAGNKPITKKGLYRLLQTTLEAKGYTMVDTGSGFLSVVKMADAAQMNLPFMQQSDIPQMETKIFTFRFSTAESMGMKIKHFMTKNGKLTFSKESNALIVSDFPEAIATIEKAMKILDVRDESTANTTHVISLKNADAKSLVTTLNTIIGKMTLIPGQQPPSITSDDSTNSIVIIASNELYKSLESTIKSLDHDRQQVYVRAKIIEVSENKSREIGIKYGFSGGKVGSNGLFTFDSSLGDGSVSAVSLDSTLAGVIAIPTLASGIALGANISLLSSNGAANILSEPSILCIDNQESSIYVGKTESISSGTTLTGTGLTQENYTRQDIGLTLKIKPRLSNDNKVLLGVSAKLEDVVPNSVANRPSTTKREVLTSAIVNNGESVIIGGLIREKHDQVNSDVPFFSEIPLLGNLFKNKERAQDRINLVIILTPYIIEKSGDINTLRAQLSELDAIEERYIANITKNIETKSSDRP
jgi:general secretion pathway protein D